MRLTYTLISVLFFSTCFAQIPNGGFRNWTYAQDTFSFSTYIPFDTFSYFDINNWTSSNQLTGNPNSGGTILVNRDTDAALGKYVVKFNTDSIYIGGSLNRGLIAPGFIINGLFRFDLGAIIFSDGGLIDPAIVAGAGSPVSQRYDSIGVWVKYSPVNGDSLLLWAVLKSRGAKIAETKVYSTQASGSYTFVGGKFAYLDCAVPDTMVVMIASSNPNFSTLLSGTSGLVPGSVMWLDSVALKPFTSAQSPIASQYNVITFENHAKTVNLASSDSDCSGNPLGFTVTGQPVHGTAVITGADTLLYTPALNFTGVDTIYYSASNGQTSTGSIVRVSVFTSSGINEPGQGTFSLFPNPAGNLVQIVSPVQQNCYIHIISIDGRIVTAGSLKGGSTSLDISTLPAGLYIVKIGNQSGEENIRLVKE